MKPTMTLYAILFSCILLTGCISRPEGRVNHVVICWLKNSGSEVDRKTIKDASESFRDISGVINVHSGTPIPSNRKAVDDSFDIAIFVTFANEKDMNAYLKHPIHEKAKNEILLPLVKKVTIYDFSE